MRCRAKRRISWAGHDVGNCTRIIVFISTTRAAILIETSGAACRTQRTRQIQRFGIET